MEFPKIFWTVKYIGNGAISVSGKIQEWLQSLVVRLN